MAQIDNIVQVTITRQTAQVDITSFDIPLLLVEMDDNIVAFANERVRTYTSLDGVGEDLGVNHAGYQMAVKLLGGDVKPNQFKIGKVVRDGVGDESYAEALNAVIDVDDTWYAVITESHEDADIWEVGSIIQAMRKLYFTSTASQLAYEATQSVTYTATVQYDLTGLDAGDTVSVKIAGETYTSTYDGSDWGTFTGVPTQTFTGTFSMSPAGLLTITNTSVDFVVTDASQAVADGYTGAVDASDISDTNPIGMDIGQRLKLRGLTRTIILFSNTADVDYPEAVWVGGNLPYTPGNITWEYKSLPGVTVSRLTDTQINTLENRGYNYYIPVKGVNITRRGKVAAGDWIDELQITDWLYARLQEQVFYRLVNTLKIPFTEVGAVMIENEIFSVLTQAQANGAIDTFSITAPRVLAIPEMQRAARIMGDFKFTARLQGAVSVVRINGVLTV